MPEAVPIQHSTYCYYYIHVRNVVQDHLSELASRLFLHSQGHKYTSNSAECFPFAWYSALTER